MSRADLFVYIALAAAWILVAAWAFRIGGRVNRLQRDIEAARRPDGPGD